MNNLADNSIENLTIKKDLCISCGICKIVCPQNAITMQFNKYYEVIPYIDKKLCVNCGICTQYCPNIISKMKSEAIKFSENNSPQLFGLEHNHYYLAWNSDKFQRQKCCSGGAVTKIAEYLFDNKIIDGMIHVERVLAGRNKIHYRARLSKNIKDIISNVSSAYQPIDFSFVLKNLEQKKTYFITGTPCVIRGVKNLFKSNYKFKNIKILTCALVCSHNTNLKFIDYLADKNNVPKNIEWKVNIRQKDDEIFDANNFNNHFYNEQGTFLIKNRHKSGWTNMWRNYYFAMNCCLYCSDFWGYEGDISVKDAWGKWAEDKLGKSIIIVRNKFFNEIINNSGLVFEQLAFDEMKEHQISTLNFKQNESYNKNFKSIFFRKNRKNGLLRYKLISKLSKILYKNFDYKLTDLVMKLVVWIMVRIEKL